MTDFPPKNVSIHPQLVKISPKIIFILQNISNWQRGDGRLSQSWQCQDFESAWSHYTCPRWSVFEGNCLKRTAFFGSSRSVSNLVTVSFDYFTRLHLLRCHSSRCGLRETAGTIWAHLSTHSAAYCPRFANPSLWTLNEGNVALPPSPQEELVDPSCKADEERNLGWLVRSRIAWYKFLGPKTSNSVPALGKVQNWRRAGREVCQVLLTTHLCSTGGDRHANQNLKLQNGKYGTALCCSCILSQSTNNVKKSNIG